MAKKAKASDQSPLSHYWTPPAVPIDSGLGEPWACLATTYEFDAEFFEAELLPRFLGLKFDQTENEPSFLVEREEALALGGSRFWSTTAVSIPRKQPCVGTRSKFRFLAEFSMRKLWSLRGRTSSGS